MFLPSVCRFALNFYFREARVGVLESSHVELEISGTMSELTGNAGLRLHKPLASRVLPSL